MKIRTHTRALRLALPAMAIASSASLTLGNSLAVIDGAGRAIGYYGGTCNQSNSNYLIYSLAGYYSCFDGNSGLMMSSVVPPQYQSGSGYIVTAAAYTGAGCIGDPLIYATGTANGSFFGGMVITIGHDAAVYADKDTEAVLTAIQSTTFFGGSCNNAPPLNSTFAVTAQESDISATGLSNVAYAAPFRIEPLPDSALADIIFFDGFE